MKRLVLVRHGDITGGDLSPAGERQADRLGRHLRDGDCAPGRAIRVVSSPAPRARQTASILCSFLGLMQPEEDGRLWSGPDGDPDGWEHDLVGLVRQLDRWSAARHLLVVVTHFEICTGLPRLLAIRHQLVGPLPEGLARGDGLWIDPETRQWRHLKG